MKYILEEKEKPMFYSSYGKYIHELIELYNNGIISASRLPTEFLTGFSSRVSGKVPSESIASKYISCGLEYFKLFKGFDLNMIASEMKVNFKLGKYKFTGVIDYLGEKDGNLYIIDHKSRNLRKRSGRSKPTKYDQELDDMLVQLYLYAEAVKQKYGKYPTKLIFNCFRENEIIEEDFNDEACEKAKAWAVKIIEEIKETHDFYPYVEFFQCKYLCGLNEECDYWNGGDSY